MVGSGLAELVVYVQPAVRTRNQSGSPPGSTVAKIINSPQIIFCPALSKNEFWKILSMSEDRRVKYKKRLVFGEICPGFDSCILFHKRI